MMVMMMVMMMMAGMEMTMTTAMTMNIIFGADHGVVGGDVKDQLVGHTATQTPGRIQKVDPLME